MCRKLRHDNSCDHVDSFFSFFIQVTSYKLTYFSTGGQGPLLLSTASESLECKSETEASFPCPLRLSNSIHLYDQLEDRSQLYYCDPMLQHISICRRFLSLLDGFNASPGLVEDRSALLLFGTARGTGGKVT